MNVRLIAHSTLSDEFKREIEADTAAQYDNDRAALALTAIRTCYSATKPTDIIATEGAKYFGRAATDGEGGAESDRLFRHINRSKHVSTLEHVSYTFAVEGVSRALLAQLTRHRHLSYSVQSQRYVRMGSVDKSGGFSYVTPPSIRDAGKRLCLGLCACEDSGCEHPQGGDTSAHEFYDHVMYDLQTAYDTLRSLGVPAEDARMVLPAAATTNIVLSGNLRALTEVFTKRKPGAGAQHEIADLAERIRAEIVKVDPWAEGFF